MKSRLSFHQEARFLLVLNLSLILGLLLTFVFFAYRQRPQSKKGSAFPLTVEHYLSSRSKALADILNHELEEAQKDTQFIAEWTSHIFTYSESYRLAAQPSEYDYDEVSGLYGAVRNDGSSVAFLSSATFLNPDIIRDIRLTEYLNPIFKNVATLNPNYDSIGVYTLDSFVRSFPWFDFKRRISNGVLKPNFSVSQFSFFRNAAPENNPDRKAVWELISGNPDVREPKAVCSVPFSVGRMFKGVVVIEVKLTQTASVVFERTGDPNELSLLLSDQNSVLALNNALRVLSVGDSGTLHPVSVNELRFYGSDAVRSFIEKMPVDTSHFDRVAGFYLLALRTHLIPAKLVMLLPESRAASLGLLSPAAVSSLLNRESALGAVAVVLLLIFNSIWIYKTHREVSSSTGQLEHSFSALALRDWDSSRIANPAGIFCDVFQKFNDSLQSLNKELEILRAEPSQPELPDTLGEAAAGLDALSMQLKVLSCFEAAESMESNLSRLLDVLGEVFLAERAWFMFYNQADRLLQGHWIGRGITGETLRELSFSVRNGSDLETVLESRQVIYANSIDSCQLHSADLSRIISRNMMVGPLTDEQKVFGIIVLVDRRGDFDADDQSRLQTLQAAVSKVLRNLLQCEGLRKIDLLRREYLAELTKAAEIPLGRIRAEVQSIYSRLGRLAPYYKQHCEVILFEVGKLYEIAREFNGFEVDPLRTGPHSSGDAGY